VIGVCLLVAIATSVRADEAYFREQIAPILARRCLSCHNDRDRKGDFSFETRTDTFDNELVDTADVDESTLLEMITPDKLGKAKMPKNSDPLTKEQRDLLRDWIASGAKWPKEVRVEAPEVTSTDWWSLRKLARPTVPKNTPWASSPIDDFISAQHTKHGLAPAKAADRRSLMRRVYFDLIGLPPSPAEAAAYLNDKDPQAYEKLIDRLLASPRYGERWARHWLDVVHYGDTHGYDKDKLRPNAWPYRDYVIRALNSDRPYDRFIKEQLAGDVLYPKKPHLIAATGFIVAGPWDFIGHVEVPASKMDGQVARNLDRDDMVTNTIQTFNSMTVQCARCHNHKFDPITQEDYYSLQAVFAAIGRNNRSYDISQIPKKHALLTKQRDTLTARAKQLAEAIRKKIGPQLASLDKQISTLEGQGKAGKKRPQYGYHSKIVKARDIVKWVQVDLGAKTKLDRIVLIGAHDEYKKIGAGFGFPVRFKVEVSDDAKFATGSQLIADHTANDFKNPGVTPVALAAGGESGRYIRVTVNRLNPANNFMFALAELQAWTPAGANVALTKPVTAPDSIEARPRWAKRNLTDGIFYSNGLTSDQSKSLATAQAKRQGLLDGAATKEHSAAKKKVDNELATVNRQLKASMATRRVVYSAATKFKAQGNHRPLNGKPLPIHVLVRGNLGQHGKLVGPGALRLSDKLSARFELGTDHSEGDRRIALANWVASRENPLTWRSIVNRVWLYHFGRGIVNSPNDLGRMGQLPSHPELIDWLAVEFRDGGQFIKSPGSIKQLHKLILTSSTYRQSTTHNEAFAKIDSQNRFLWRANRRRLEAEAIRDTTLQVAGKLKHTMYGPGFRDFVLEQSSHSPQFAYEKHNPDDEKSHRRSVYRFLPRSQPQPFMETLDCADPSQQVAKRDETVTALSALALLNNKFMVRMAEHFAARLEVDHKQRPDQISAAFQLALNRAATDAERKAFAAYADEFGLPSACRVILNLNEFVFVD